MLKSFEQSWMKIHHSQNFKSSTYFITRSMPEDKPTHNPEHIAHLKWIEARREKQRLEIIRRELAKPTAERVKHLLK
mgnify:FL=1